MNMGRARSVQYLLMPPLRERSYYDELLGDTTSFLQYRAISVSRNKHHGITTPAPRALNSSTIGIACSRVNRNFNARFLFSLLATHNSGIDSVIGSIV